jgi:hypothetical protein
MPYGGLTGLGIVAGLASHTSQTGVRNGLTGAPTSELRQGVLIGVDL